MEPSGGRHGGLLGRLGAVLGRLGAVLGASRAVLGRSWGPLGRSWSVRSPKRRESKQLSKTIEKSMVFASWGLLGTPLGGLLALFGCHLNRLGTILDLGLGVWASWSDLWASRGPLGPSWDLGGLLGPSRSRPGPFWGRLRAPGDAAKGGNRACTREVAARGPGPGISHICIY